MVNKKGRVITALGIAVVLTAFVVVYKHFNPSAYSFFPKCPSRLVTGFDCPGCGSQRAVHHLLNLEFGEAAKDNLLVVLSIPYIITGFIFDRLKHPSGKALLWRRRLFGTTAIWIILGIITLFTLVRNVI